jgi:tyrosinase
MFDMAGYTTSEEPATGWVNTTLGYEMSMYGVLENVTVEQVMNVQGGYLCYEFEY